MTKKSHIALLYPMKKKFYPKLGKRSFLKNSENFLHIEPFFFLLSSLSYENSFIRSQKSVKSKFFGKSTIVQRHGNVGMLIAKSFIYFGLPYEMAIMSLRVFKY